MVEQVIAAAGMLKRRRKMPESNAFSQRKRSFKEGPVTEIEFSDSYVGQKTALLRNHDVIQSIRLIPAGQRRRTNGFVLYPYPTFKAKVDFNQALRAKLGANGYKFGMPTEEKNGLTTWFIEHNGNSVAAIVTEELNTKHIVRFANIDESHLATLAKLMFGKKDEVGMALPAPKK